MKRFLLAVVCLMTTTLIANAQQGVSLKTNATILTGGKFNALTVAGGTANDTGMTTKTAAQWPLYTKLDTVTNTGADTLYQKIVGMQHGVYSWCKLTGISGTNTSCTLKAQVSGDVGRGTTWETVATYTVTSTGEYKAAITGWSYTNLRWILTGVGTHSTSWYAGLNVR